MSGVVGTMDTVGWVMEPTAKIDWMIAWWFANRVDQSTFLTQIPSYQFEVATHQDDKSIEGMLEGMKRSLTTFMSSAFEQVELQVNVNKDYKRENKMYTLFIAGRCLQDGVYYDIADSVIFNGETFKHVSKGRVNAR